jgi:hypothetical protein
VGNGGIEGADHGMLGEMVAVLGVVLLQKWGILSVSISYIVLEIRGHG